MIHKVLFMTIVHNYSSTLSKDTQLVATVFFRTRLKNSDFQCKNKQESTISDRITTIFAPVMYILKLDKDI